MCASSGPLIPLLQYGGRENGRGAYWTQSMQIYTFTMDGIDIEVTYNNGSIAYTFQHDGDNYGYKINLTSKKVMDIVAATSLLLINALETKAALTTKTHDNAGIRTED